MSNEFALQMRNVTKTFGKTVANKNVCLDVRKGEILALLGENGSGKTTLMNMLSGIYFPDHGQILMNGEEISIVSPKDALDHGIGMIHQHFKLIDVLSAAENVVLGLKENNRFSLRTTADRVKEICDRYGFVMDPFKKVYDMSVSEKQTLEIIKVLYRGSDILILDEPTAVLTPQETDKLFTVIRNMKADGKSIIIITHKLHEVMEISDRVAVLRKGEYIGTVNTADATELSLTEMMVGKRITLDIDRSLPENPQTRLIVNHVSCISREGVKVLDDVSFDVHSGEILGIAGIAGSGQKELLEAIAGLQPVSEDSEITYYDPETHTPVSLIGKSVKVIRNLGVLLSFVPEDRLGMGLVGSMGMTENMMLKTYNNGFPVFTNKKKPRELAEHIMNELEVVTPGVSTPVSRLSGGNVQKVLVGREIASAPSLLMTAYAVRGLDINTSHTIYRLLEEQKRLGVAVIYVGEDLDVLLDLCDRILILCGGKNNGIVDARTTSKEQIGLLMTNLKKEASRS